MSLPIDAKLFEEAMDPGDVVDFVYEAAPSLAPGEMISATWTVAMSPEGAALGVTILNAGAYAPELIDDGQSLRFWLSIASGLQQSALFDGTGIAIAVVLRMTTTNVPPRTLERSVIVTIRQR